MSDPVVSKVPARWLLLTGLVAAAVAAGFEIQAFLAAPQSWDRLLSDAGLLTLVLYVAVLLAGLFVLTLSWFSSQTLAAASRRLERLAWVRWAAVASALLSVVWFYLYSPWVGVWPGPWSQLMFAMGLAAILSLLARPASVAWLDGRELFLSLAIFLYPRVVLELRAWYTVPLLYRGATVLGYLLLVALTFWVYLGLDRFATRRWAEGLVGLGPLRWVLAALALLGPLLYLAVAGALFYILNPAIRFALLLVELAALAFLIGDDARALSLKSVIVSAFALAAVSFMASGMLLVVDYPFSLGWSEGNRFYDYSLLFGQDLYQHTGIITNPYGSPGRYVLWGALFLLRGLPIQFHRFWNALLYVVPPVLVGWFAARKVQDKFLRAGLALFIILLFTVESPLHPPFLLAAALVLAFMYSPSLLWRGLSLAIASFYVGTSRWTWIPVTAAWGVLADLLLYYPSRQGSLVKRLTPTALLALAGLLPGLISGYGGLPLSSSAREYNQPLLWYRLLPNPTFPLGVLLSAILISAPLIAILAWWVRSRRWKLDWVQQLAAGGALLAFLGAGLVVSMKIGGGADLHNLDMYLMTLALIAALGVYSLSPSGALSFGNWPFWSRLLLAFMLLYPLYEFTPFSPAAAQSTRLELAKSQEVEGALRSIQQQVNAASRQGEVLFMDQRQLLTFGYVHDVQFVSDYEKKYMMDQAMAADATYFQRYYQDLARQRFRLIVTEILHTRQEHESDFSEENNAWVKWVSEPTLCFYQPVVINKDVNVELLVPKPQPVGCDAYMHPGE
jgi:hypothetical protein